MAKTMYNAIGGTLGTRNAFTVHNLGGRRYYSSIDATILLNGKEVTEVVQIQWQEEEQTFPLFGYNSYVFDEMAKGSRVISGQFAINFTVPDYLNQLIKGTEDKSIDFKNNGTTIATDKHGAKHNNKFTISVNYGSKDAVLGNQPCIFLEDCYIKSCGQALDTQGQALVEIYDFIARDKSISR